MYRSSPTFLRVLATLCVLATSACYTFRSVGIDELVPGLTVRARVTGAFSDSLSPILLRDARDFEGVVVENAGSSVFMDIAVDQPFTGMRREELNQRVEIPAAAFVDLEVKEFNRGRTIGVVALGVAALAAFVVAQFAKPSGGASGGAPGGPQDAILPLPIISVPVVGIPWIQR